MGDVTEEYRAAKLKAKEKVKKNEFKEAKSLLRNYGNRPLKKTGTDAIIKSARIKGDFMNHLRKLYALDGQDYIQKLKGIASSEGRVYFNDVFNSFSKRPGDTDY